MCIEISSAHYPVSSKDINLPEMPYIMQKKNLSSEPASNWQSVEYFVPTLQTRGSFEETARIGSRDSSASIQRGFLSTSIQKSIEFHKFKELVGLVKISERPSELHSIYEIEMNEVSK